MALTKTSMCSWLIVCAVATAGCGSVKSATDAGGSNIDGPIGSADAGTPDASGPAITAFVFRAADNAASTATSKVSSMARTSR